MAVFIFLVVLVGAALVGFIAIAEPAHIVHFYPPITVVVLAVLLIGGAATKLPQATRPAPFSTTSTISTNYQQPVYSEHAGYSAAIGRIASPYLGGWGDVAILGGLAVGLGLGAAQKASEQA